jgi:hypothetical protein
MASTVVPISQLSVVELVVGMTDDMLTVDNESGVEFEDEVESPQGEKCEARSSVGGSRSESQLRRKAELERGSRGYIVDV